jgi:hypothetical protein
MMGDRLPMGISARNRLRDEFQGFSGRFHPSTRDDPPSKDGAFKALLFTEPKHSIELKLHKMMENQ